MSNSDLEVVRGTDVLIATCLIDYACSAPDAEKLRG